MSNRIAELWIKKVSLSARHVKVEEDADTESLLQSSLEHPTVSSRSRTSQEQRSKVISYIVNDKMFITVASRKANISRRFYCIYFNHEKPDITQSRHITRLNQCTQEDIEKKTSYIFNDRLFIRAALKKGKCINLLLQNTIDNI